ncbi:LacI family DNA-binding transcriptional regulator [Shimia sp.]|uniref:LacI family DNA-binding transcriptional regulator n=1 Tax=Shimia sp. TaxID=1954381 RepID=UPI0032985D12
MNVTLKDVAARAGVSRSAVSRTFTDGASVSRKMRRKVEKAASDLGYSPNFLARSLTTRRTKLIGLVADNYHNPVFLKVFDLFTRGLQDRDLRPLLVNLSDETDPLKSVQMLKQYSVDGVVVASSTLSTDFAHAFRDAGVPVLHAFGRNVGTTQLHVVGIDNVECGRMAAREFLARGYTNVGFLGGPPMATSTKDRASGFLNELSDHPKISVSNAYADAYSFNAGRETMRKILNTSPAQAYFCGDDVIAIGAMSAIRDAGLSIPGDMGLIGLNDMEMAGWANINLTTIHQPIREMVESSIELMVSILDDPDRYPEVRMFPCTVVERGTLKPR